MKKFLVILKDTQGTPDFFHPSEIMGNNAQQVKRFISEDTPLEYIQGVYTPQEYLHILKSKNFYHTLASLRPDMPEPAIKKQIANMTNYVQSLIQAAPNTQQQNDLAKLATALGTDNVGGGDLPQEENFDIDTQTAPAPQYVINPHPSNIRDGDITTNPFGKAPKNPQQLRKTETKYFTESGIKFKLENGELYKKEWTDTPIEPYMDKVTDPKTGEEKEVEIIPDFRLINKDTRKPMKSGKIILQQAIWKKIES